VNLPPEITIEDMWRTLYPDDVKTDEQSSSSSVSSAEKPDAELREWKDDTGRFKTLARLIRIAQDKVRLQKLDGKEIDVPISRLSSGDSAFVAAKTHAKHFVNKE